MITQDMLADAASTLAHLWATEGPAMNRIGVERLIRAYPAATQLALCTMIWRYLEDRHSPAQAEAFTQWMCDLAGVQVYPLQRASGAISAALENV
jgi:hypothetical protein